MLTTKPMINPPTNEELEHSNKYLSTLDSGFSNFKTTEYITIKRTSYIAQITIKDNDLFFHFYGTLPANIDSIFGEVFKNIVIDTTNFTTDLFNKLTSNGIKNISPTLIVDIYTQLKNHPAQLQKSYEPQLKAWTYKVKDGDTLYVDVLAKKIIDLIDLSFECQP